MVIIGTVGRYAFLGPGAGSDVALGGALAITTVVWVSILGGIVLFTVIVGLEHGQNGIILPATWMIGPTLLVLFLPAALITGALLLWAHLTHQPGW